jgi:hypothetical protein
MGEDTSEWERDPGAAAIQPAAIKSARDSAGSFEQRRIEPAGRPGVSHRNQP